MKNILLSFALLASSVQASALDELTDTNINRAFIPKAQTELENLKNNLDENPIKILDIGQLKDAIEDMLPLDHTQPFLMREVSFAVKEYIHSLCKTVRRIVFIKNTFVTVDYKRIDAFYKIIKRKEKEIFEDFDKSFQTYSFQTLEEEINHARQQIDIAFPHIINDLKKAQGLKSVNPLARQLQDHITKNEDAGQKKNFLYKPQVKIAKSDWLDDLTKAFDSRRSAIQPDGDLASQEESDGWSDNEG